jgi:hypothetical protein
MRCRCGRSNVAMVINRLFRPADESVDCTGFPGRLIGGGCLILGPLVFLAGLVVRHIGSRVAHVTPEQQTAFDRDQLAAPSQLAAYAQHPGLVIAGYALFALGAILLVPGIVTFAGVVARRAPHLAFWGGTLFILAMLARLYFSGVDQTGFQLVDTVGLQQATTTVLGSYGDLSYGLWRIPVTASVGSIAGTLLLAGGAFRAGVFGLVRCLLLVAYGWIWMGILKEATLDSLLFSVAGALVLVPFGIRILRGDMPEPSPPTPTGSRARQLLTW